MNTAKRMWELKQAADDALDLYIYGDVEGDRYDDRTEELIFSQTSAEHFRYELEKYPNVQRINIYINSYGGSVFEGTAIYNQLRRHSAYKTVYIDGFACSIASVIAMAGDKIIMPKNALMMIHNMWMGVIGNAAELRKAADDLDVINAAGRNAYLAKAGDKLTADQLAEMMDAETWLTAEQCIALGLADEYAERDADMADAAKIINKAALNLEQRIAIHKSLAAQLKQLISERATEKAPPQAEEEIKKDKKPMSIMEMLRGF